MRSDARLSDISEIITDGTHASPERTDGGIPVLSAQNVRDGHIDFETERFTSVEEYDAFAKRISIRPGDLLLTIVGTIGRAAVVDEVKPAVFQRSVAIIRFRSGMIEPRYALHITRSAQFQSQLRKYSNQSAQAGVYLGKLGLVEMPVPSLDEQQRIAAILDKADALCRKRKRALELLDGLTQSIFLEIFGDPIANPKGWPSAPIGEVCDVRDGTHDSPKYCDEGFPLLTSKNFSAGLIDFSGAKLISLEDYNKINKRSKVDVGDIVMPMIGTIGSPVLIRDEARFAIKNVALFKFGPESPCPEFAVQLLAGPLLESKVSNSSRGGTQKFLSLGDLRKMEVILPPKPIQLAFKQIDQVRSSFRSRLELGLCSSDKLFHSLQSRAFSGQL